MSNCKLCDYRSKCPLEDGDPCPYAVPYGWDDEMFYEDECLYMEGE